MTLRVVFDTGTVVSALLFQDGQLAWLRRHWRDGNCVPLLSRATAAELVRVLNYPKFRLSPDDQHELLGEYLPFCETVSVDGQSRLNCRDTNDQIFLDLAEIGRADVLVSGDKDPLDLSGTAPFLIEAAEAYRHRVSCPE